jgi:hypothetical protein
MRPTGRLIATLLGAMTLTANLVPAAVAQDPSVAAPSAVCSLLDAREVGDALAVEVAITTSDDDECTYESDATTSQVLLVSSRRSTDSLDDLKSFFEGDDIEVAGQPARFTPGIFSRELYVSAPDGGTYTLQVVGEVGEGVDHQTAMTGLAALALSRLAGSEPLTTEAPIEPDPSFAGDAELEALFPAQIGGMPITVQSLSGADLAGVGEVPPALQAALGAAGKTLADVRIGIGYAQDATAGTLTSISAFQVKGTDISTLKSALLPILFEEQRISAETALQVGGKAVTVADVGGTQTYLYPRGDILWVVTAVEPALTEIFASLP